MKTSAQMDRNGRPTPIPDDLIRRFSETDPTLRRMLDNLTHNAVAALETDRVNIFDSRGNFVEDVPIGQKPDERRQSPNESNQLYDESTLRKFRQLLDEQLKGQVGAKIRRELLGALFEQYDAKELGIPLRCEEIAHGSPSFRVLWKILDGKIKIDMLTWREFEEFVADLLEKEGYTVDLGPGRKDGGMDIIATMQSSPHGFYKAVWQAKKLSKGHKVGLPIIRELADTRNEHKANKGMIVTSTYLTKDAMARVEREMYLLGKVDNDDIMKWVDRVLRERAR